jgi:hypothetical protein
MFFLTIIFRATEKDGTLRPETPTVEAQVPLEQHQLDANVIFRKTSPVAAPHRDEVASK